MPHKRGLTLPRKRDDLHRNRDHPIPDGMHDWTLSAELMAKVLAAKGYHYQFLFARNAKHIDRPTIAQTLPAALEWLWKGYLIP